MDCFVAAPNFESALTRAVRKLAKEGWVFEDVMDGQVYQIDPLKWDEYVESKWPEFRGHFPTQSEISGLMQAGEVFCGPFCGWSEEDNPSSS